MRASTHVLDWPNQPLPFKIYTSAESVPLPRDLDAGSAVLDGHLLARLCVYANGITRTLRFPGGEMPFRAAACTGALYHIELYLACGGLPDLEAGVYHYAAHSHALDRLRYGDFRAALVEATRAEPHVARAPVVAVLTSTFWRNAWKYQARAYRHTFWDSGTVLANLLAVAAAHDVPARVVLGFADDAVNRLLDVDGQHEAAVCLVALGEGDPPGPAPPIDPLGLPTRPLSATEVDYPEIHAMHAASCLGSGEEAAAWRPGSTSSLGEQRQASRGDASTSSLDEQRQASRGDASTSSAGEPTEASRGDGSTAWLGEQREAIAGRAPAASGASGAEAAVRHVPGERPVEEVVRRRGSARRFAHAPIERAQLEQMLAFATQPIDSDVSALGPLSQAYLIVNAVEGLEPGTYVTQSDEWRLLRQGAFREAAGFLDLGQALAADAALNVYWLSDLDTVLDRLGNRGYRAAQLDAAIQAGRLYLAAYALGLGATGLTFFDDEVTRFFSPHAEGKAVMFLMAVGHPARRRTSE